MITKYGYTAEVHYVTTEDGYILRLHRIAGGPKSPPSTGKKVCFLMHGIMDSSAGWCMMGPNKALGLLPLKFFKRKENLVKLVNFGTKSEKYLNFKFVSFY